MVDASIISVASSIMAAWRSPLTTAAALHRADAGGNGGRGSRDSTPQKKTPAGAVAPQARTTDPIRKRQLFPGEAVITTGGENGDHVQHVRMTAVASPKHSPRQQWLHEFGPDNCDTDEVAVVGLGSAEPVFHRKMAAAATAGRRRSVASEDSGSSREYLLFVCVCVRASWDVC